MSEAIIAELGLGEAVGECVAKGLDLARVDEVDAIAFSPTFAVKRRRITATQPAHEAMIAFIEECELEGVFARGEAVGELAYCGTWTS
jgi:hypothetical protein